MVSLFLLLFAHILLLFLQLTQKSCVGEDYTNPSTALCAEVLDVVEDVRINNYNFFLVYIFYIFGWKNVTNFLFFITMQLTLKVSRAHILEPHCILVSPVTKDIVQNRRFLKDDYSIQLSKPEEPPFYCRVRLIK